MFICHLLGAPHPRNDSFRCSDVCGVGIPMQRGQAARGLESWVLHLLAVCPRAGYPACLCFRVLFGNTGLMRKAPASQCFCGDPLGEYV